MHTALLLVGVAALASCGVTAVGSRYVKTQWVRAAQGAIVTVSEAESRELAGLRLEIPPGALPEDTVITVEIGLRSLPGVEQPASATLILGPEGLTFLNDVTLVMPLRNLEANDTVSIVAEAAGDTRYEVDRSQVSLNASRTEALFWIRQLGSFEARRRAGTPIGGGAGGGSATGGGTGGMGGGLPSWAQEAYLKASNTEADDHLGYFVALSGDGSTLAVGAGEEDSNAPGINAYQGDNSAPRSGAVYVFRRAGNTWAQEAYLKASNPGANDVFGSSIALSADGNILAVGARWEASGATGVNGNQGDNRAPNSGAAYVFRRTGTGWAQEAYLKASNTEREDHFGIVALSADGTTLAVGAPSEDGSATGVDGNQGDNSASDSGAVYVFRQTGTGWAQEAYVKASNTGRDDEFGTALALSGDGSTLAVGAFHESSQCTIRYRTPINCDQADNGAPFSGAVYVFRRTAMAWAQEAYLKATSIQSDFGISVSLTADGSSLAVGAILEWSERGVVYVFVRTGNVWILDADLHAENDGDGDQFGKPVRFSADGSTLAVGAVYEDSNATGLNGGWSDNSASGSGAAYVFRKTSNRDPGVVWAQEAYLKASNTQAGDRFGNLALSGDGRTLAVGAPGEASSATGLNGNQDDNSAAGSGACYVFKL